MTLKFRDLKVGQTFQRADAHQKGDPSWLVCKDDRTGLNRALSYFNNTVYSVGSDLEIKLVENPKPYGWAHPQMPATPWTHMERYTKPLKWGDLDIGDWFTAGIPFFSGPRVKTSRYAFTRYSEEGVVRVTSGGGRIVTDGVTITRIEEPEWHKPVDPSTLEPGDRFEFTDGCLSTDGNVRTVITVNYCEGDRSHTFYISSGLPNEVQRYAACMGEIRRAVKS